MILTMRLMDASVVAGCPANSLVFDGSNWIKPEKGQYATLVFVQPTAVGEFTYPVQNTPIAGNYEVDTSYCCLITDVQEGEGTGVVSRPDPLGGECLCLVCNQGTQLLNIKVTTS